MADRTRYSAHTIAARNRFEDDRTGARLSLQRRAGICGLNPARTRMIAAAASHTVIQSSLWTSLLVLLVDSDSVCFTRAVYKSWRIGTDGLSELTSTQQRFERNALRTVFSADGER